MYTINVHVDTVHAHNDTTGIQTENISFHMDTISVQQSNHAHKCLTTAIRIHTVLVTHFCGVAKSRKN